MAGNSNTLGTALACIRVTGVFEKIIELKEQQKG